jgi:hypothetical protein
MLAVRLPDIAANAGDCMAGFDEHGGEKTADVPCSTNDNYAHFLYPLTTAFSLSLAASEIRWS